MKYYVYILLDDRYSGNFNNEYAEINFKPFYVGKGTYKTKNKSKRYLSHYSNVISENNINPHKSRIISKLKTIGFEPNYKIIFETNCENEAFEVETKLIEFYGRVKFGGILTNITIGGIGGDTFTNNPNKNKIRLKHSENTKGKKKNPCMVEILKNTHLILLN